MEKHELELLDMRQEHHEKIVEKETEAAQARQWQQDRDDARFHRMKREMDEREAPCHFEVSPPVNSRR